MNKVISFPQKWMMLRIYLKFCFQNIACQRGRLEWWCRGDWEETWGHWFSNIDTAGVTSSGTGMPKTQL